MNFVRTEEPAGHLFTLDTTIVLFFLAVETAQNVSLGAGPLAVSIATLATFVVVPYCFESAGTGGSLARFIVGRLIIAVFGVGVGVLFARSLGTAFPDWFAYLPMTLLLFAAMFAFSTWFFNVVGFRLAR